MVMNRKCDKSFIWNCFKISIVVSVQKVKSSLEHLISVHLSEPRHLASEYALFSSAIKITFLFLLLFLRINIYKKKNPKDCVFLVTLLKKSGSRETGKKKKSKTTKTQMCTCSVFGELNFVIDI